MSSLVILSDDSRSSSDDLPEIQLPTRKKGTRERRDSASSISTVDVDAMFDCVSCAPSASSDSGAPDATSTASTSQNSVGSQCEVTTGLATTIGKKRIQKADRVTKKQKLLQEKEARKATANLNKMYKPAECMKYMYVEIHPELLGKWYAADVEREVALGGARVAAAPDLCDPRLVMWSRRHRPAAPYAAGQVENSDRCLLVVPAEEVAPLVRDHTLSPHVATVADITACHTTLVVFGAKDYFKSTGRKTQQQDETMTEVDLEMALTDLLVSGRCDSVVVNSAGSLALLVAQFTKAVAETPYKKAKRACDERAEFYMRGGNRNCVAVDKDGHGLSRVWQQMLATLALSSLEVSRAVSLHHPSPLAMYEALRRPDGLERVSEIGVARAGAPGARARRVGPELARRLRTLFTADNGDTLLD